MEDYSYTEEPNSAYIGGVVRRYTLPNGYVISAINGEQVHFYPYAWEFAVISPKGGLDYTTPLTNDVEVFSTETEASAFLKKAFEWGSL